MLQACGSLDSDCQARNGIHSVIITRFLHQLCVSMLFVHMLAKSQLCQQYNAVVSVISITPQTFNTRKIKVNVHVTCTHTISLPTGSLTRLQLWLCMSNRNLSGKDNGSGLDCEKNMDTGVQSFGKSFSVLTVKCKSLLKISKHKMK